MGEANFYYFTCLKAFMRYIYPNIPLARSMTQR